MADNAESKVEYLSTLLGMALSAPMLRATRSSLRMEVL